MFRARNKRILVDCPSLLDELENGYSIEASLNSGRKLIEGIAIYIDPEITDIKNGDVIIFPRYAANELPINGKMYFSVHNDDVEYIKKESR